LRRIVRTGDEGFLFRSSHGTPLTRDGEAYLLCKYVRLAAERSLGKCSGAW
jgi:hypothetical protein